MNVIDILNEKRKVMAQNSQEFREKYSPQMRDYWNDFVNRANSIVPITKANTLKQAKPIEVSAPAQELLDELLPLLDQEIHVGQWHQITQEQIDQFGKVTLDTQWIHNEPEKAAAESPFKTTIAHGFLTLSLLTKLTDSVNPDKPLYPSAKMTVNYGLDNVRFPYPVKVNSNIRAHSVLKSVTPIRRGLEIVKEFTVEIEGCRRPGCVAESIIRLYF